MFSKLTCKKSGSKPACWLTLKAKCIVETRVLRLPFLKSRGAHLRHLFYFSASTSLPVTCYNQNYWVFSVMSLPVWRKHILQTRKPFADLRSLEVIPDNLSVNCLGMNLSRRSRLQGYTYFVHDIHCIRIDARNSKRNWSETVKSPCCLQDRDRHPRQCPYSYKLPTCGRGVTTWATSHVPSSLFPQTLDQPALQQLPLWTFSVRGRRRN